MTLAQMQSRFFELKGKLAVGHISEDEFKREMESLRFQDEQGRWWMIGAQSGRWYYYDGTRWLLDEPPEPPLVPPRSSPGSTARRREEEPAPRPSTKNTPYIPPAQIQRQPKSQPYYTAPPHSLTERVRDEITHVHVPAVHVPPVHMPHTPAPIRRYPPNLILLGSGLIGLLLVAALWLAVDNLVPGKPITSFFGKTLGGATPTRSTVAHNTPVPAGSSNVDNLLRVGDELIAKSQFAPGLVQYQSAARLAPNNADVFVHWARASALSGRIQEAIDNAQRATRLDPTSAAAFAELTRALAWSGQIDAATSAGAKAIALDAKNATAHAFLAEAQLRAGRLDDAQKESSAALDLDDNNADAHRSAAWIAVIAGRSQEAIGEWGRVVSLAPDIFFYHFEFGQLYSVYLNDAASAIPEYQKAADLFPPYVPTYIALGRSYISQNQPGPALLQFQKALTFDPNSSDAYVGLGLSFQKQERCSQAIPYFQKSLELNPASNDATRGLSDCGALAKGQATPFSPAATTPVLGAVPTAIVQATIVPVAAQVTVPAKTPTPGKAASPATAGSSNTLSGRIAYAVYDGQYHLYIQNAEGGSNPKLVAELASMPAFSPDGSQLLYSSWLSDGRGIHRIEADGSADQAISLHGEDVLPSWSPDGTRYVYATRAGLGADINKRTHNLRIADPTARARSDPLDLVTQAQYPTWGPNNKIVFRDCGFPTDTCGLAIVLPDGSNKRTLIDSMNATAAAWSPDGTRVAYTSDYGGNWDIYIIGASGGSPARLTTDPAEDGLPTFSPNGKFIAFLSHRGGIWAIWAMGIDGSNQRKLFDLKGEPAGPVPGNAPGQPGQVWYEQRISWR